VSIEPTATLHVHWSLLHGVDEARFTGGVKASAALDAAAHAAAGCELASTPLLPKPWVLSPIEIQVGPVPVVIVPEIQLYLTGDGSISADLATGVHASLALEGGLDYSHGRVSPVATASPSFSYTPPTIDGQATLGANLTPTLNLLIYGIAGPELAVTGGLRFDASSDGNWALTAPISATAALEAPVLGLDLGKKTVFSHTFSLAKGQFAASQPTAPPPPPPPPPSSSGQRTVQITWDTGQTDIDLHVWDPVGDEAWYQAQSGVPSGQLSQDIIDGWGPETFTTTDTSTPLMIGVCYYGSHTDDGSVPPTDVTVTITEANGSTRTQDVVLNSPGDEQLVDTSPNGAAAFSPDPGWCYADNGGTSP
jgi:hypothetical protein